MKYAYREMMTLTDPQRLVLRQPLPWLSGQTVEVLIVSEAVTADFPPIAVSAPMSWAEFLVQRNDLLAKNDRTVFIRYRISPPDKKTLDNLKIILLVLA